MSPLREVIINKQTAINPIWIMRQAGRYLPEFREIRKQNPDFIKLCLNKNLSSEITLQPLKRFDFDAAIIFSDILMVPYGLNQNVEFKKNFGPLLGNLNLENILEINETDFIEKIHPVYKAINLVSKSQVMKNKSMIGFAGAPWTLLVYMINQKSPKLKLKQDGTIMKSEILDHQRMNRPGQKFYKVLAESALRAVRLCQPLKVPPTGYDNWKDIQLNFNPAEMLKG